MLARRSLLPRLCLMSAGLVALAARAQAQAPDVATAFVSALLKDILAVVNGGGAAADKRAAIARIIDTKVDVDGVARFCLGRFWRTATPAQQQDYVKLFHTVLLNSVAGKVGEYSGVSFTMGATRAREEDVLVSTVVSRPNNAPSKVDWVVANIGGQPKLVDLIAEGTSLRLTQRSDYASFLASHGNNVQTLLDAIRAQLAKTAG